MATLVYDTKVGNGNNPAWWMTQLNIYGFATTNGDGGVPYIHFKTNVSASTEKIFAIEAVGYNYGWTLAVRCVQSLYTTGGGSVVSKGSNYSADGLYPDGVYKSSDNYACVRFYKPSHYYNGFILNAYTAYYYGTSVSILAASQNGTSGNYY
jgi:hypothetical protein